MKKLTSHSQPHNAVPRFLLIMYHYITNAMVRDNAVEIMNELSRVKVGYLA